MKRIFMITLALIMCSIVVNAQKYAYVDSEYILNKLPSYKSAENQLTKMTEKYQKEVEEKYQSVDVLFKKYQSEKVLLTDEMRQKRESEIIAKEKEVKELQQSYFSPEGDLAKKREELLKPIQEKVYESIKELATEGGYATIFDVSNNQNVIFTNPRYDLSDKVLSKLGVR